MPFTPDQFVNFGLTVLVGGAGGLNTPLTPFSRSLSNSRMEQRVV